MKRLQPVIWMKGTFLSPQHMQTQDRFIENTLEFSLKALEYCPWGFHELQIDLEALAGGYFSIARASGIFPDGLLFDMPDADQPPSPKSLPECFDQDQVELDVYLAIPHHREKGLNVSMQGRNADTRYLAEYAMLRDENTGLQEKPVQVARKNFRVLTSGESQQGVSVLKIAHITKNAAGQLTLDNKFVPPTLDISSSEYLVAIVRRLVEIIAAKSAILSGLRRQKNLKLAEFGSSDTANFWLLYTLNTYLPVLQHIFEVSRGHPERLYAAMLELAGALTTFSTQIHPRDLPTYDHDDLTGCFTDLDEKIRFLLENVVPSNFVILPLKLVRPFIYAAALAEDRYLQNTQMFLAIQCEMNEGEMIAKVPYLMKAASSNDIDHLVQMALPGVPLDHRVKPPSQFPSKVTHQYFTVSQSGPAWESIRRARNFALFVPGDFPNPNLELVILLPEGS